MKKNLTVSVISTFILILIVSWTTNSTPNSVTNTTKENTISLEDARASIVSIGERIEHEDIYFHQWEALNSEEKKQALVSEDVYLFSISAFKDKKNEEFIQKLIDDKKTLLFYGYQLDVEKITSKTSFSIPYYPMESSKEIFYYVYGITYSVENEQFIPVTVMGNFSENEMEAKIGHFLIKYFGKS